MYHCRCKICERAVAAHNEANGHASVIVSPQSTDAKLSSPLDSPLIIREKGVIQDLESPPEIQILENDDIDGEGEDEVEEIDLERQTVDGEDDDSRFSDSFSDTYQQSRYTPSPEAPLRSRKRSSDELDNDADEDVLESDASSRHRHGRTGTPPKRARREEADPFVTPSLEGALPPIRIKKRSSTELDDSGVPPTDTKRLRVDQSVPLRTGTLSAGSDENEPLGPDRRHSLSLKKSDKSDLDGLYVLLDDGH